MSRGTACMYSGAPSGNVLCNGILLVCNVPCGSNIEMLDQWNAGMKDGASCLWLACSRCSFNIWLRGHQLSRIENASIKPTQREVGQRHQDSVHLSIENQLPWYSCACDDHYLIESM